MTEKDINIEDEETLNEEHVEEREETAAEEEATAEVDVEKDPLEQAQDEIA